MRVVQRTHDLKAREHAVVAVEFAARGLGIDVAARGDGGQGVVQTCPACEQIADGVDADGASRGARLRNKEIAALAIKIGEGQAADTALGGRTDLGKAHQRIPKALSVDAKRADERIGDGWRGHTGSPFRILDSLIPVAL